MEGKNTNSISAIAASVDRDRSSRPLARWPWPAPMYRVILVGGSHIISRLRRHIGSYVPLITPETVSFSASYGRPGFG